MNIIKWKRFYKICKLFSLYECVNIVKASRQSYKLINFNSFDVRSNFSKQNYFILSSEFWHFRRILNAIYFNICIVTQWERWTTRQEMMELFWQLFLLGNRPDRSVYLTTNNNEMHFSWPMDHRHKYIQW